MTSIPQSFTGRMYSDFLSDLCLQRECRRYLEIGVQAGLNLSAITVHEAIGIDPSFDLRVDPTVNKKICRLHRTTSDSFFKQEKVSDIDMAFLDGMHLFEFLLRDFYNVEASSNACGLIAMHDCLPLDDKMIARHDVGIWTGDVWKVVLILEKYRPDLGVVCVDCAPTGLICVTNLDPSSTVLKDQYVQIVKEFTAMPNTLESLEQFYHGRDIISAHDIISGFRQSLYFRV